MLEMEIRIKPFAWLKRAWAMPVIVIATFFICLWLVYRPWAEYGIDWPAWVQAVGSLIGICIAISVPAWQRHQSVREKREEAQRSAYENALMGHKACVEVDQFLSQLITRNGGERYGWHDKEYFRAWAATLQRRFALLIEKETTSQWWSLFLTAQAHLMEIDAALRVHAIDSEMIGVLAKMKLEKWSDQVEPAREKLRTFDCDHPRFRREGLWG